MNQYERRRNWLAGVSTAVILLLVILLTAVSRMNVFFSLALVLGLAVFPAVYIYRLYNPLEEVR